MKSHGTATELALTPVDKKIAYTAGQFAFLRFESEQISSEPHPFSFASSSKSRETVRVIMKHGGDFTDTLPRLHIGDRVRLEGPYGKFTLDTRSGLKNIRIAGGIGITPFMAMADELVATPGSHTAVDLYYLVRTPDDLIGLPYFQEIADTYPSFRVVPRVSTTQ